MKTVMMSSALALLALTGSAQAAGKLTLYCSPQEEWCQLMVTEFTKATGIEVAMTRKSSGETYAQILAEKDNPKGDVWWGGTGDPHLQAAEEGLTEVYESSAMAELHPWAISQYEASGGRTVGIYAGALGFGYNSELLAEKGLEAPACWGDLVKPEYVGEVQMANPNSSGTAYTTLATVVQLMGEDEGFEWLKSLHANINQYTKSGSAPIKAAARGETTVGIVFQHDAVTPDGGGFPDRGGQPLRGHRLRDRLDEHHRRRPQYGGGQAVLRLRLACRHPGDGGLGRRLSGAFQHGCDAAPRGAGSRADQADRLRLQDLWFVRRAYPPALEVGYRRQRAPTLILCQPAGPVPILAQPR